MGPLGIGELHDELREKFAFHMADVADHLTALAAFYGKPGLCDVKCLSERVKMFFVHCLPHLMAAAQIYDEIPHIFDEPRGVHDWDALREGEVAE